MNSKIRINVDYPRYTEKRSLAFIDFVLIVILRFRRGGGVFGDTSDGMHSRCYHKEKWKWVKIK